MPATIYIEIDGQRLRTREAAARVGISPGQMSYRIRNGIPAPTPKRDPKESARCNPDPFGWSWRRGSARPPLSRTCACGQTFTVTAAVCKRGWGMSCSKSCAAIRRERGRANG